MAGGDRQAMIGWAAWAPGVASALAAVGLTAAAGSWRPFMAHGHPDSVVIAIVGGFFAALIISYRPKSPVGWLLLGNALAQGAHVLGAQYGAFALHNRAGGAGTATWLGLPPLVVSGPLLALVFLRFPDGRPLSGRWRRVEQALVAVGVAAAVAVAVLSWPLRGPALLDGATLPDTHQGRVFSGVSHIGQSLVAVGLVLAAGALAQRYRRSAGAVRQQVKWVAFAAVPLLGLLIAGHVVHGVSGGVLAMASPVPELVALWVAIRRYRLYDVDRLISRTTAWLLLSVPLTGAYLLASTAIGSLFSAGHGTRLASAAGAALAAVLFQPLRHTLQDLCDRRFRRRSHHAKQLLTAYMRTLGDREPEPGELQAVVAQAVHDPRVRIAFWISDRQSYVDGEGQPVELPLQDSAQAVQRIDRAGEHLGIIVHYLTPTGQDRPEFEEALATVVPAFDHARLRAQTLVRLEEVKASRSRLVIAADEARKRVERDLHDGAQQQLVALGLNFGRLHSRAVRYGNRELAACLTSISHDLEQALAELRQLARGIHPSVLTEQGLGEAVASLVERSPLSVTIHSAPPGRLDPTVEVTAYYLVAEALTNAAKHAPGSEVIIKLDRLPGTLRVEIADDGPGGAEIGAGHGTGLAGLVDRVEALGGHLELRSARGAGTRIVAELPA